MEKYIIENVEIVDIGHDGKAIGKSGGLVIFADNAVPGDFIDVEIYKKKKTFSLGKNVNLRTPSPHRREAFCSHFGLCGGCKWQHFDYAEQLNFKYKQVVDAFERIAKIPIPEILPVLPSVNTKYYRNRLDYSGSNKKWVKDLRSIPHGELSGGGLGFHLPGWFDKVIDIEKCYLQPEPTNAIRNAVREFALANNYSFFDLNAQTGWLRGLIIRTTSTNETMVILIVGFEDIEKVSKLYDHIIPQFKEVTSWMYVMNTKKNDTVSDLDMRLYKGREFLVEEMSSYTNPDKVIRYIIGPKSFFQTNTSQASVLFRTAADFANLHGDELVYDLYTGAGAIANYIANSAERVVGLEYVEAAVNDARKNSDLNQIKNTSFFAGDMKDLLNDAFIAKEGKPDVIITDPPRAGMHEDVVKKMMEISCPKIVYVSCNPASLARDCAMMADSYEITAIQPIDMFPHTSHIETVVLLEKKS